MMFSSTFSARTHTHRQEGIKNNPFSKKSETRKNPNPHQTVINILHTPDHIKTAIMRKEWKRGSSYVL